MAHLRALGILVLVLALLPACGGSGEETSGPGEAAPPPPAKEPVETRTPGTEDPPEEQPADSGGWTPDSLMAAILQKLESVADVVEVCGTADELKACRSQLEGFAKELRILSEDAQALGKPSEEVQKRLARKYVDRLLSCMTRLRSTMERFSDDPEITDLLETIMSSTR